MIELPDELSWLKIVAGMEWPDGDETEMWALAQDWRTAAEGLRAILPDIDDAKTASLKAYPSGEGVAEMTKALDSMRSGDQSLGKLAEYFDLVGESVDGVAMEIEYTKMMFWTSLLLLAAELAAAWLWPPTALLVEGLAIAATRIAVRLIGERATAAIMRWVARAAANTIVKFLARHVAIDATLGTMQEYLVQQWQVDKGSRDKINVDQVIVTAISSAAGGAAAGPAGEALGKWLKNNGVTDKWLQSAITGPAAGLVGAGAGLAAATATQFGIDAYRFDLDTAWDNAKNSLSSIDPLMFTAGASNGFMSGVNKVGANTAWQHMAPGMSGRSGLADRVNPLLGDFGNIGAGEGAGGRQTGEDGPGGRAEGRADRVRAQRVRRSSARARKARRAGTTLRRGASSETTPRDRVAADPATVRRCGPRRPPIRVRAPRILAMARGQVPARTPRRRASTNRAPRAIPPGARAAPRRAMTVVRVETVRVMTRIRQLDSRIRLSSAATIIGPDCLNRARRRGATTGLRSPGRRTTGSIPPVRTAPRSPPVRPARPRPPGPRTAHR